MKRKEVLTQAARDARQGVQKKGWSLEWAYLSTSI